MGTHMKTTIDIADELLRKAKAEADRTGTTLKSITEQALRLFFSRKPTRRKKVKPVVVKGHTPPHVFQNLHQLILSTYEEREARTMRAGSTRDRG